MTTHKYFVIIIKIHGEQLMKTIKIRVTKEIEQINTCTVTDKEYEEINNGHIILEDILWQCNEENCKVELIK